MLTVPFCMSGDSVAEEPMTEAGYYFKTSEPLTEQSDFAIAIGDDIDYKVYSTIHSLEFFYVPMDIDPTLLKEYSIETGVVGKVDGTKIVENIMAIESGKINGSYGVESNSNSIDLYGKDVVAFYKYLGDDRTAGDVTITLDLTYSVETYSEFVTDALKIKDEKYVGTVGTGNNYVVTKIAGTVKQTPDALGEPSKNFSIDYETIGKNAVSLKRDFVESDASKIEVGAEYWESTEVVMDYTLKYDVTAEGKTYHLEPNSMIMPMQNPIDVSQDVLKSDQISDSISLDISLVDNGSEYSLKGILNRSYEAITEEQLRTDCETIGVVLDTYSDCKPKIKDVPDTSDEDKDGINVPLIAGGIAAGVVVIGGIAFFLIRRRG